MTQPVSDDKRVQRTRQALFVAFSDLVLSRPYADIKIADIIDAAGVGRSTFYEHYQSKDDVLRHAMSGLLGVLADTITPHYAPERVLSVVVHFWQNRARANALNQPQTRAVITRALASAFEERLALRPGHARIPAKLLAQQLAEAQFGLLWSWLAGQASCSADQIADTLAATTRAIVDAAS
ncbi:MAG: TetR/AcrR family transcriptional regulator [Terricaulis sp.]